MAEGQQPDPSLPKKHRLQNRWCLWYFKNDKSKDWKDNLKLVISFDTVEDFWAVYNHIVPPSGIATGCDYMLFKDGIQPMWEDDKNKHGGRWLVNIDKKGPRPTIIDQYWIETLMCLIGEAFGDSSDEVCGAVVNIRPKGNKIAIWTGDVKKRDNILHIGKEYKERLGLPPGYLISYQSHTDTMIKTGSSSKSTFTV
ncbi:eukaryotic translation initiation factor 4E-1A-like [Dysidea avara]|uniref:eukaryotic translation initiation factor 4E-1A-like n=1 Tax=Dysidea avara TaxID=196820 RepID=UPI00332E9EFD